MCVCRRRRSRWLWRVKISWPERRRDRGRLERTSIFESGPVMVAIYKMSFYTCRYAIPVIQKILQDKVVSSCIFRLSILTVS